MQSLFGKEVRENAKGHGVSAVKPFEMCANMKQIAIILEK
jgi:hypothetical protein